MGSRSRRLAASASGERQQWRPIRELKAPIRRPGSDHLIRERGGWLAAGWQIAERGCRKATRSGRETAPLWLRSRHPRPVAPSPALPAGLVVLERRRAVQFPRRRRPSGPSVLRAPQSSKKDARVTRKSDPQQPESALGRVEHRVEAGLHLVPQDRALFAELTVEENLALGGFARREEGARALASGMAEVYDLFPRRNRVAEQTFGLVDEVGTDGAGTGRPIPHSLDQGPVADRGTIEIDASLACTRRAGVGDQEIVTSVRLLADIDDIAAMAQLHVQLRACPAWFKRDDRAFAAEGPAIREAYPSLCGLPPKGDANPFDPPYLSLGTGPPMSVRRRTLCRARPFLSSVGRGPLFSTRAGPSR